MSAYNLRSRRGYPPALGHYGPMGPRMPLPPRGPFPPPPMGSGYGNPQYRPNFRSGPGPRPRSQYRGNKKSQGTRKSKPNLEYHSSDEAGGHHPSADDASNLQGNSEPDDSQGNVGGKVIISHPPLLGVEGGDESLLSALHQLQESNRRAGSTEPSVPPEEGPFRSNPDTLTLRNTVDSGRDSAAVAPPETVVSGSTFDPTTELPIQQNTQREIEAAAAASTSVLSNLSSADCDKLLNRLMNIIASRKADATYEAQERNVADWSMSDNGLGGSMTSFLPLPAGRPVASTAQRRVSQPSTGNIGGSVLNPGAEHFVPSTSDQSAFQDGSQTVTSCVATASQPQSSASAGSHQVTSQSAMSAASHLTTSTATLRTSTNTTASQRPAPQPHVLAPSVSSTQPSSVDSGQQNMLSPLAAQRDAHARQVLDDVRRILQPAASSAGPAVNTPTSASSAGQSLQGAVQGGSTSHLPPSNLDDRRVSYGERDDYAGSEHSHSSSRERHGVSREEEHSYFYDRYRIPERFRHAVSSREAPLSSTLNDHGASAAANNIPQGNYGFYPSLSGLISMEEKFDGKKAHYARFKSSMTTLLAQFPASLQPMILRQRLNDTDKSLVDYIEDSDPDALTDIWWNLNDKYGYDEVHMADFQCKQLLSYIRNSKKCHDLDSLQEFYNNVSKYYYAVARYQPDHIPMAEAATLNISELLFNTSQKRVNRLRRQRHEKAFDMTAVLKIIKEHIDDLRDEVGDDGNSSKYEQPLNTANSYAQGPGPYPNSGRQSRIDNYNQQSSKPYHNSRSGSRNKFQVHSYATDVQPNEQASSSQSKDRKRDPTPMPPMQRGNRSKSPIRNRGERRIESYRCTFCFKDDHDVFACLAFSADDKFRLCNERRLCFKCFLPGHSSAFCRYPDQCQGGSCAQNIKHNVSLCSCSRFKKA